MSAKDTEHICKGFLDVGDRTEDGKPLTYAVQPAQISRLWPGLSSVVVGAYSVNDLMRAVNYVASSTDFHPGTVIHQSGALPGVDPYFYMVMAGYRSSQFVVLAAAIDEDRTLGRSACAPIPELEDPQTLKLWIGRALEAKEHLKKLRANG